MRSCLRVVIAREYWFSKCGPETRHITTTWKLVRNGKSWASPQTYWIRISGVELSKLFYRALWVILMPWSLTPSGLEDRVRMNSSNRPEAAKEDCRTRTDLWKGVSSPDTRCTAQNKGPQPGKAKKGLPHEEYGTRLPLRSLQFQESMRVFTWQIVQETQVFLFSGM